MLRQNGHSVYTVYIPMQTTNLTVVVLLSSFLICIQFIAEDTRCHYNNLLWAYNLQTSTLTRILSAPRFAEVTGQWMTYWGKHAYLTVAMQHPGDEPENSIVSHAFSSLVIVNAAPCLASLLRLFATHNVVPAASDSVSHTVGSSDFRLLCNLLLCGANH